MTTNPNPTALLVLIMNIAQQAMLIPREQVTGYLAELRRTVAVMPMIDPTGFREIASNIPEHERLMQAFLRFQDELATLRKEA